MDGDAYKNYVQQNKVSKHSTRSTLELFCQYLFGSILTDVVLSITEYFLVQMELQ